MAVLSFNEKTKAVKFEEEDLAKLSEEARTSAQQTTDLINLLSDELVHFDGPRPPVNAFSESISTTASKLVRSGADLLGKKKPEEALRLFNTALEVEMRRPVWERTTGFLDEVSQCLAARCDAQFTLRHFPEAYADATLLTLMKPMDHLNLYRKSVALIAASQIDEAENLLKTALFMSPNNPLYIQTLRTARPTLAGAAPPPAPAS